MLVISWFFNGPKQEFTPEPEENPIPFSEFDTSKFVISNGIMTYEDDKYTSEFGIDVSQYQKKIDWKKVAKAGVSFAMIRVGYRGNDVGGLFEDKYFEQNIEGALKNGIKVGVYFYTQAASTEEALEEASFVIKRIKKYDITMPVAFDMEYSEPSRIADLDPSEKTEIAAAFLNAVAEKGYKPIIYGSPSWLMGELELANLTEYDTWLAHYTDETPYPFVYSMWQYSDEGKIKGIKKKVDLDIYVFKKTN